MKKCLDYGSGSQPKKGFLSSDFCGAPNYDYYIKDYRVLDAEDHSFDVLHCRNVIHHIPEKDLSTLFREFYRLLKPGGQLTISEPRKEFHFENKILDLIWYRFLKNESKIMIPKKYVDFRKYLVDFELQTSYNEYNNEVLTFSKVVTANVYLQHSECLEKVNFNNEPFQLVNCHECGGTGVFEITDTDWQPCNCCKTNGLIPVSMY